MNPLLLDAPLFVEVATHRSFSKAAEALDLGVSTVSRRIRLLEKKLGNPLFLRDTHSVRITDAGELLLEHCKSIMSTADNALESFSRNMQQPSGRIRVSMYADVYYGAMQGVFSAFLDAYPEIQLNIHFFEDSPGILSESYDVILRQGPLPDSSLVAKKLFTIAPAVYASPKLLEKYPAPVIPQDLRHMPCITLSRFGSVWELRCDDKVSVVHTTPQFIVNSALLVQELVLGGHGVGLLRENAAASHEASGQIVRLLPQWHVPTHDLFIMVGSHQVPRRVRVFVDYMAKHFL
ncbi:MAG: LysR family transcriptional regulator [Proteobacteria bacterium]|nr:LysR family transcriptional regulator [Pseudomonadota bacterium]MCL2308268.1 LysR family transcriptional regulator [Pseudomonadota bacterium]MCL2308401.1 LysR family transcriptional regulator [Pseudomonadota bacterium]